MTIELLTDKWIHVSEFTYQCRDDPKAHKPSRVMQDWGHKST